MFYRNSSWLFCIFVAAAIATDYSDADSIRGSDPDVAVYSLRTNNPAPSTMEPVQEAKETTDTDLAALLDAGANAVVVLVAGDTRLAAHRAVLVARSPVFATMLLPDQPQVSSDQVKIQDVEGEVLRHLVAYLYTLQAPQLPGMAPQLLAAADRYGLPGLKAECEQQLAAQLSIETAAAAAVLAVRHSCTNLTQAAVTFIKEHILQVNSTQGWADAMQSQPEDLAKVIQLLSAPPAETSGSAPGSQTQAPSEPPAPPTTRRPRCTASILLPRPSGGDKCRRIIQAAEESFMERLRAIGDDRNRANLTVLHWAAYKGEAQTVVCLLEDGVDVDVRDLWDRTPLLLAVEGGHRNVVILLAHFCADVNARSGLTGDTPLHVTVKNRRADIARILLSYGADREAKDICGRTTLENAIRKNIRSVLTTLRHI